VKSKSNVLLSLLLSVFIVIFMVSVFRRIATNAVDHNKYVAEFTERCAEKGGVVKIPRGIKGWPIPSCFNPDAIIDIEALQ